MDRRRFLFDASAGLAAGLLLPRTGAGTESGLPAGAESSAVMDALPGKRPLIKRTYRPPNYETPVAFFRHAYTPTDAFYVRWHAGVPDIAARDWRLRVGGPAAARPREYTLQDLKRRFARHEVPAVNQCSGNRRGLFDPHVPGVQWGYGAMGNALWGGIRLKDVLEHAGIAGGALEVAADGGDSPFLSGPDFVKSLPVPKALDPDTLIAFEMNGEPLPRWHGFPARLVVPGWTATYWVKALTSIAVLDRPFDGFWMKTAYRVPRGLFGASGFESQDTGVNSPITAIRVNSLIVSPEPASPIPASAIPAGRHTEVRGIAWDGGSGIRRVECSVDAGATWREARLGRDLGRYAWRQWSFPLRAERPGPLALAVRAQAADGSMQAEKLVPNPAGYHHNVVQQATYAVI